MISRKQLCSLLLWIALNAVANPQIDQLIQQADLQFQQQQIEGCLQNLRQAEQLSPADSRVLWRLSRAYSELGNQKYQSRQKESEKEAHLLFLKAETMARKSVEIAPNDSQCYLYLSVAVGSRTQTEGNKKKIELAVVVKNVANRAVELDPGNHYAHYILARWHHNLANVSGVLSVMAKLIYGGLPPASNQQAIHHFQQGHGVKPNVARAAHWLEQAVKHEPDNITYRLEFARASLTIKKWQLAQQQLDQIQLLEAKIYADRQLKIEAEQMRTKVGKHTKFKTK